MTDSISHIPRFLARNGWSLRRLWLVIIVFCVAVGLTLRAWETIWYTAIYYHNALYILLVPPISVWLFYVRRYRIRFCTPYRIWVGFLLLVIGLFTFECGRYLKIETLDMAGSLIFVLGGIVSVLGVSLIRYFLSAIVVYLFIIPVPYPIENLISEPLQIAVFDVTHVVYNWFDIGLHREGEVIVNTSGQLIQLTGSGRIMGMLMTYILMAYAFAFGLPLRSGIRAVVILVSPFIAVVTIVIQSIALTWLYDYYDPMWVHSVIRNVAWCSLIISIAAYYLVIRILIWTAVPVMRFTVPKN